ncbi:hypothetical protein [uncultured Metabacillus sp.]|uniref:hypothetical protein n=1 Tax=uncultured Metabacillus sp. TaxID=2860135 RepID=UPI00261BA7B8|nr:hypothetical protein [uncultured Metabacillus sp.]
MIKLLIKKLINFLKLDDNVETPKIPENYKECPHCEGTGHEDLFYDCEKCNGTGIVRKTYQEYVDSLPPIK